MMSEKSLIEMMEIVAGGLGDLLERVVFVGGATTPLYYEDAAATRIRPTTDVDCLVEITSRGQYNIFEDELRRLMFKNDMRQGAPLCRWIYEDITVDVMPIDEQILGFSNRWYPEGMRKATTASLPSGREISIFSLLLFSRIQISDNFIKIGIRGETNLEEFVILFRDKKAKNDIKNNTDRTEEFWQCRVLRTKNDTAQTFSAYHELPKQAGATGLQLYSHLKFVNLKKFDEERNRLVRVSAFYEVIKQDILLSGLIAFCE